MISAIIALIPRWLLLAAMAAMLAFAGVQTVQLSVARSRLSGALLEVATLHAAIADANTLAAQQAADLTATVLKAQNEAHTREAALRSAAAAAATESDGLRSDVEALRASLAGASSDAAVERAAAIGVVLGQCAARYQVLAQRSDRHVSDLRTLMDAWPK
jgi:hypothetical protein